MEFQTIFDSVCRCFGHAPTTTAGLAGTASNTNASHHQPATAADNSSQSSVKRRTNRLGLKDEQWDELFGNEKNLRTKDDNHNNNSHSTRKSGKASAAAAAKSQPQQQQQAHHHHHHPEDGAAQAVAQAKLAANPTKYHRSKRKRSVRSKEEIFRSKNNEDHAPQHNCSSSPTGVGCASVPPTSFSRLLNPSLALCFATPIRGTEEEQEDMDTVKSLDNSDTNTLNTCEDTITSTVYFENKYSHLVETRPPMPLFNQFKIGNEKDEIRQIMETDSHSSLKMIRLLQQQQQQQQQNQTQEQQQQQPSSSNSSRRAHPDTSTTTTQQLEDSSSDSEVGRRSSCRARASALCMDQEMEDAVPDVKAVSSSTDSSRQSQTAALLKATH
jgi:hypothetical protein